MSRIAQKTSKWLDRGLYTPDQASRLLQLGSRVVRRWAYGHGHWLAAIMPENPSRQDFVSFLDLVQMMAIREIREHSKLSLQKIRAAIVAAKKQGIDFPFARRHTAYVFRGEVVLRLSRDVIVGLTGRLRDQHLMEPIIYTYMDDLGFDDRGIANLYVPMRRAHRCIQLDPLINFGAPSVMPCRYTVESLVNARWSEGTVEEAASVCGVSEADVKLALDYEASLAA